MKKVFKSLVVFSLVAFLVAGCSQQAAQPEPEKEEETVEETTEETTEEATTGELKDGTYTASKNGMNDEVEVSVTFEGGKIADVKVTNHSETPGIGGELKDSEGKVLLAGGATPVTAIPERIVEHQSLEVDMVTGATITSYAVINAVKDCVEQAGGSEDMFKGEMPHETKADMDVDVVVAGGGGAGVAAAIEAAQNGRSVVIVEKNGSVGGDTLVCGAIYNAATPELQEKVEMTETVKTTIENALAKKADDPEKQAALEDLQAPVKAQWDEYKASGRTDLFDSKEWHALQTWINGDMVANPELVKALTYNAYDGLKWIEDMGMEFKDEIGQGAGALWQRTLTSVMPMGTGFFSTYVAEMERLADKITLYEEVTAKELIMDGDKAVGVKAVDNRTGEEITLNASQGVIIATGGFSANGKLVQEYNTTGKWPDLSKIATTNRFSCSQGDGIIMARDAGASLTDMEQIQLLYLGNLKDGQLTKYPPRDVNGTDQIIFINTKGERFVNEGGRRDEICLAVLDQPDQIFYMLESGDGDLYKDINDPEWRSADGFTFQYLEENGYIYWDETLEGLAKKLDMDPATLQATVDTFNATVDSGDDAYGRTLFSTKLENGPWVATPRQACVHHTMGGITIDGKAHVLNENGEIIKNLYAAGETTGGIHGGNRLGGNAVVDTVVFGKLAADTLLEDNATEK